MVDPWTRYGFGWGLFYVLTPVVLTEITEQADRVRVFTLLSVFIMAGFGLSPVLGAYLVKAGFGIDLTFTVTAVLCLLSGTIFNAIHLNIPPHKLLDFGGKGG